MDFGDFTITKREVLASVSIIAIMLVIGVFISSKIFESTADKNEVYNKAVKITDSELFSYGMRTNVGNAFVYGDLEAVDPVSYPEIEGEYMYICKDTERYTKHYRTVTKTRKNSKGETETYEEEEEYWTWDRIDSESLECKELIFCGVKFDAGKIRRPSSHHIKIIREGFSDIRYVYYGTDPKFTGTIFTKLSDNTISDNNTFYKDSTIEDTVDYLQESGTFLVVAFWIFWIVLICGCVYGFYYLDNNWLE